MTRVTTGAVRREPGRSTFVTVVAWIFIVLSGLASLIGILQNVMVWTLMAEHQAPASAGFFARYPQVFFAGFLLVNLATFAASLGLLLRKNWARLAFIGLMGLGIAWIVFASALQWVLTADMPADGPMAAVLTMIKVMTLVFAAGLSVLFGWIIKRLGSQAVKVEFLSPWYGA